MKSAISIIVILIGGYMVFSFSDGGWMTPPVMSGFAFILIGISTCPLISSKLGK